MKKNRQELRLQSFDLTCCMASWRLPVDGCGVMELNKIRIIILQMWNRLHLIRQMWFRVSGFRQDRMLQAMAVFLMEMQRQH